MKETWKRVGLVVILIALFAAILIPGKLQKKKAMEYGEQLFCHSLPEGAEVIQKDAGKTEDGAMMAAMILQTDLDSQALEDFYGDTAYAPYGEGQQVVLAARPLDEASLQALEQAKLREDGARYQFIYLTSSPE